MQSSNPTFGPGDRPEIDYPGPWPFTIFGTSEELLRAAVAGIVGELEHTVAPSKKSRTGKFVSLNLEVIVIDEDQRLGIGKALSEHDHIGFVL